MTIDQTKNWVEISSSCSRDRYETLSSFLNKNGVKNKVDFVEIIPSELDETLPGILEKYDIIRVGSPFLDDVTESQDIVPLQVTTLGAADVLYKIDGKWSAKATLYRAIIKLTSELKGLDLTRPALVVGSGGSARSIIGALVRVGYSRFTITEQFDQRGEELVKSLRKTYFNVTFDFTPHSGLTMLPGIHSCVVNTTPLVPSNQILRDLYYFNFLQSGGLVIDLNLRGELTPLLREAKEVGAEVVSGLRIAALSDMEFYSVFTEKKGDTQEYYRLLGEKFKSTSETDLNESNHQD